MDGAISTFADFAFAALTNDRGRSAVARQVSVNYLADFGGVSPDRPAKRSRAMAM